MAGSTVEDLSEKIDTLLEQYLTLLDQYTTLRTTLSTLQISVQQSLARANFDAPRGIRYGEELYDARMQASRVCRVVASDGNSSTTTALPHIKVVTIESGAESTAGVDSTDTEKDTQDGEADNGDRETKPSPSTRPLKVKDPIRMFGILTPHSLRVAQAQSIDILENTVAQLAGVDAQMKQLEIEIRRTKKHRAKAEAAASTAVASETVKSKPGTNDDKGEAIVS